MPDVNELRRLLVGLPTLPRFRALLAVPARGGAFMADLLAAEAERLFKPQRGGHARLELPAVGEAERAANVPDGPAPAPALELLPHEA